ncbi:MAG: class I SAM-dependent RNA methyltransferase [Opitutales bacterium]|nr:class I SAM-dependent RNA methyltransferase [Opitutales bacterium]
MQEKAPKNFVPTPFEYHQIVELEIDDLTNLGSGVGRIDGWVVMVPYALGGERVKARIYRNHKNYSEADLVEVVRPSPDRVEPQCSLFGVCGGCQYQHLSYAGQLEWKRKQVADLMKRIGGIDFEVSPTHPSPKQYGYRSKLTPHYERPRNGNMPVGFIMQGRRNTLVDVEQCPIASQAINKALPEARARIKNSNPRRGGTLLLRDCMEGVCQDNNAIQTERVGDIAYQFCAGEFFQNNPFILPELIDYAISEAQGTKYLVDAYCGVGVFALASAKKFEKVAGVEISSKAIVCANANAKINNIDNCEFLIGKAETIFADVSKKFEGENTSMIIDPPRAGCDTKFLEQLIEFSPKKLVYVSCGPDTQARDLAFLTTHGYKLLKLQPFDLFPQTRHIENVATLEKI